MTNMIADPEKYKYRTELHAHTSPASWCGRIGAKELIKTYASLGFDSIVITNHFAYDCIKDRTDKNERRLFIEKYIKDFHDAYSAGVDLGVTVIVGTELRFSGSHNDYLFFGIDESFFEIAYDYLWRGLEQFSHDMRNDNTLLIQAHPFRDNMVRVDHSLLDGIEVYNMHPVHNSRVALAAKYAKENNLIVTGGSDTHDPDWEGLCALLTKQKPETSFDIVKILKSRDYLLEIGGSMILPYGYVND